MALMARWSWVFGLAGVLSLLSSATIYWLLERFDGRVQGFLAIGAAFLFAYAALDRDRLSDATSSRAFSYSSGSTLMQLLVVMIGLVGFVLVERYDHTWDVTADGEYTLSEHSLKVVAGLDEPVRFLAFIDERNGRLQVERLLRLYDEASDQVSIEWIDPLSNPQKARLYDVTTARTLVIQQADRVQTLSGDFTEEVVTQKLVIVQSAEDHIVCWSVGHDEADPDDEYSADGLGSVVIALEALNFQVLRQNVATEGISRECEALVVARPRTDWLPFEREALAAYLAEGGRVMVLLDDAPLLYEVAAAAQGAPVPPTPEGFVADLERFGFRVGDDIVLDPDPRNQMVGVDDPSMMVLSGQGIVQHAITDGLAAAIIVRVARSVSSIDDIEGVALHPLLRASVESWAETDLSREPMPDIDEELVGEVPIAVWAEIANPDILQVITPPPGSEPLDGEVPSPGGGELVLGTDVGDFRADLSRAVPGDFRPKPGGRIVVYGDTDFATNQFLSLGNNRDLFLNTIAWLVDEEDQIGVRPQEGETLDMTGVEAGMLCLVSIVFVPGMAALLAAFTLVRRRFL